MKILHVINSLNTGGAERLLADMLPLMRNAGHDVRLLLLQSNGVAPFESRVRDSGIEVNVARTPGGLYSPLNVFRIVSDFKGYDVIHVHLFPAQYWAALAYWLSGCNSVLITTEHNTFNTRAKYRLTTWTDRYIYGLYDGIACISSATFEFMSKRVPRKVKLAVIENGIKLPDTSNGCKKISRRGLVDGLTDNDFMVLQVARFSEQKDQDCLIRALKHLPDDVHAVFAGAGDRLDQCIRLAADTGVSARAHFLYQRTDVDRLWIAADLGVMSSHWEGFGLAALEGMARMRPVIGSRVEGLAEMIDDTELLFTPGDDRDLADKILALKCDNCLYLRKSETCRAKAQKYNIVNTVNNYLAFYKQLINDKRNG